MVALVVNTGWLAGAEGITTESVVPGTPLGLQLVDVPHAVDVAPVHVLVVPTVNVNDELASVSLTVPLHGALVFDHRVAVTVMLAPPAGVLPVVAS
jgi:hypothetical protein